MFSKKVHTGLTAVAGNAAEAARTLTLDRSDEMDLATQVGFGFSFTPGAAGATVATVLLWTSQDGGDTWVSEPAWTYAGSGKYTGETYSQEVTMAAAQTFRVVVDMTTADAVKMTYSLLPADAADSMTVTACSDLNR